MGGRVRSGTAFPGLKRPQKVRIWEVGGRGGGGGGGVRERTCPLRRFQVQKDPKKVRIWEVAGGGGPVRERPDLRNTCPLRRFQCQAQKDPKKGTYLGGRRVGGSGPGTARPPKYVPFAAFSGPKRPKKGRRAGSKGVRSGNGPTSEIRALYGVFRPKKTQKRYVFGRSAGGGGSGPGMARPKKYVPFTAFSGPKRPKKGTYLRGWRRGGIRSGNGPTSEIRALYGVFRPKKTQKRYVFARLAAGGGVRSGTARPPKYVPFTAFSSPKRHKKGTYLGGRRVGGGSGPGTALFQAPKRPKKGVFLGGWRRGGVRSGNGPTSEIRALYGVFRPRRPKKGTYLGGRRASGVQDRLSVSKCFSRSALRYSSLLS